MCFSFCLFWSANEIPIYLLVTLLQLPIALNLLFRKYCVDIRYLLVHFLAAMLIILACALNLGDLGELQENLRQYPIILIASAIFDMVSRGIKEAIVRT